MVPDVRIAASTMSHLGHLVMAAALETLFVPGSGRKPNAVLDVNAYNSVLDTTCTMDSGCESREVMLLQEYTCGSTLLLTCETLHEQFQRYNIQ
jgi:hypothetical protein